MSLHRSLVFLSGWLRFVDNYAALSQRNINLREDAEENKNNGKINHVERAININETILISMRFFISRAIDRAFL